MKMHSNKFRDPLISQAQPVTLIIPVIEESLRIAGVNPLREQILERFMAGQPRIAVVHGSEDHPPSLGSKEMIRRLLRQIWASGAVPFEVSQSMPCEQLSYGTEGVHYALLSRNLCAAGLATHMEAYCYDGILVAGVCDKMMAGNLRALIEADLARQRRKTRPLFAMMIPSFIGREAFLSDEDRRKFDSLRQRLPLEDRLELEDLLRRPLKPHVYARVKMLLDRCFRRRTLQENEKDELEKVIAKCTSVQGANCAASEASMVHRMMLASFGLVPRHLDIALKAPSDGQLSEVVKRLIHGIQKRERKVSVANLVRANFLNAAAVWRATGSHPSWLLHLTYLADAIGKKISAGEVARRTASVPQILAIDDVSGHSTYSMAVETENGGNSGIDTIMRTLAEKRFIEDRAPTMDGSWTQRIMDARSANGNFLYSTMTPYSSSCSLVEMHGNVCSAAIARPGSLAHSAAQAAAAFDKKLYLAVCYLGTKDVQRDMAVPEEALARLKKKVSRDDLCHTYLFNWRTANGSHPDPSQWNKNRLWDYLVAEQLLRVMVVVAGAGPRATGMPELQFAVTSSPVLSATCVLVTDGRVSFQHEGVSVAHVVPEALDGGVLAAIRTGDWLYMDRSRGELHVVAQSGNGHQGYKVLSTRVLLNRPDRKKRMTELEKRRTELLPSFRTLLDQVSSAESGVSPSNKLN